ncbi:MAG: helix-turn-helix domain-containing protein [Phycisphaerales bacterium]
MKNDNTAEMNFLEQLLDDGIMRIAYDFETEIGRNVLLADNNGEIFYSLKNITDEAARILVRQIPAIKETEYYFCKTRKMLFYQLGEKEHRLIVGIQNVRQEDIAILIDKVRLRSLALKTYLDMQEQIQKQARAFGRNRVEALVKSSANIYDIIGFHNIDLKTDRYYEILLIKTDKTENITDTVTAIGDFYTQKEGEENFPPILWNDIIMIISPMNSIDSKTVADIERTAALCQRKLAEQSGVELSCGIGRFYMLNNLHKSYIEAKIALIFPNIMGKFGRVQSFDKLGVFSMIFSQEIDLLKEYVLKVLEPILSYDQEVNMQLVDTLRILLRNNFNWAKTAKDMFAHVNTIYYRYDKIEKMLNFDLSKGKDRNEAFAALTVWDVLNKIGFIGEDFFR